MAIIIKSQKHRLLAKTKYNDEGTIKSASRNLGINGEVSEDYFNDDGDAAEGFVKAFQKITTDTVQSFVYEVVTEYESQDGNFGEPGSIAAGWDGFDNVKLINNYTNGDNSSKYTVTRAATAATDSELRQFGMAQANSSEDGTTAVNGQYTGSTITSAWVNS